MNKLFLTMAMAAVAAGLVWLGVENGKSQMADGKAGQAQLSGQAELATHHVIEAAHPDTEGFWQKCMVLLTGAGTTCAMAVVPLRLKATSEIDRKRFISNLRGRARLLQGPAAEAVRSFYDRLHSQEVNTAEREAAIKARRDLVLAARGGSREAQDQLAAIYVETTQNFLLASANALAFFDVVNLASDERPYIVNQTRQVIDVSFIGMDGRARKTQAVKSQEEAPVDLRILSTSEYEYPLVDVMKGEVKDAALAQVDMNDDFAKQVDAALWPYIKGAIGAFGLTGSKPSRVYVPHPHINVGNLPSTNLLTVTGNGSTTLFRQANINAILRYCAQWGTGAFKDGDLSPVAIYLPSLHVTSLLESITLINQQQSAKAEEIFENGYSISIGGKTFTLVGDNSLDPASDPAYVRTNKGLGTFFTKTSLDKTIIDEGTEAQRQNKGSISMNKVIGAAVPSNKKVNVAATAYHT